MGLLVVVGVIRVFVGTGEREGEGDGDGEGEGVVKVAAPGRCQPARTSRFWMTKDSN